MLRDGPGRIPNVPRFTDYRTTNDGVMVADIGFKRQLWAIDPELDVVWDWGSQRWEIWKFPGQPNVKRRWISDKAYHVTTVQTKNRTFRELGADVLLKLQKFNPKRWSGKQLADYFDRMDDNILRAKEKKFKNWFEAVALETFDYVRGVPKGQVPRSYGIKPEDSRFLLKVKAKPLWTKYRINVPRKMKIQNAIAGG